MSTSKPAQCWCGNSDLLPFSQEYLRCDKCETLVSICGLSADELDASDDDYGFYGREYWESHQTQELNQPDIFERSRSDLAERSIHWLRAVLKYKLPPASVLELGSAHGGFVALLNRAGFEAKGLELSPFIVDFARTAFDVPMYCGPIENHEIAESSLDVIALMDVIEHLPDPESTMRHCLGLLKPGGILVIQCPRYVESKTYQSMLDENDPFTGMLTSSEHLNLFSKTSISALFDKLGGGDIQFEEAIFPMHDMFVIVGRDSLTPNPVATIESQLQKSSDGRFVQAMIDLYENVSQCNKDRGERLNIIYILGKYLIDNGMEASRAERIEFVKKITGLSLE